MTDENFSYKSQNQLNKAMLTDHIICKLQQHTQYDKTNAHTDIHSRFN